jgi:hypothetical protein
MEKLVSTKDVFQSLQVYSSVKDGEHRRHTGIHTKRMTSPTDVFPTTPVGQQKTRHDPGAIQLTNAGVGNIVM